MAAISRRPRLPLYAALTVSLVLAACSLLKPVQAPEDKQERALHLARDGKHAEAARAYAELAALQPAGHDNYELLSAEQWLAAGNIAAAKESFAAVSAEARTRFPAERALVAAEIAYAENDGARAIRELDQIAVPTSADLAQNYFGSADAAPFSPGTRSKARVPWSSASAGSTIRPACARIARNCSTGSAAPRNADRR